MSSLDTSSLTHRLFLRAQLEMAIFQPAIAFLLVWLLGLTPDESWRALVTLYLPILLFVNVGGSYLIIARHTAKALVHSGDDARGVRLTRLLALPRRIDLSIAGILTCGGVLFLLLSMALFHRPFSIGVLVSGAILISSYDMLIGVRVWMATEPILRPFALEEHRLDPTAKVTGRHNLLPRLSSYLFFSFVSIMLCTISTVGVVVGARFVGTAAGIAEKMRGSGAIDAVDAVESGIAQLQRAILPPLIVLSLFLFAAAVLTAWQLGRRFGDSAKAIQRSIDSIASGTPRPPEWVSSDEFGDLGFGLAAVNEKLKLIALALRNSAIRLAGSAEELGGNAHRQNETVSRQAAALQETEVTAQEIRQTSLLATQKSEAVLQMAQRAEEIGKSGETAIELSLSGLTDIREQVDDMSARIKALGERARQIAGITATVKGLADQSNMLALNAAIEAVRSGEQGKGFSVVAREMRSLADQSIQATNRVREILDDISDAIRTTVVITERGSDRVATSLLQVQTSGESLRALSGIVRENTHAVRQIAAAVGQQNSGIGEIFEAVRDLSRMMEETLERIHGSDEAAKVLHGVVGEVNEVVRQYGMATPAGAGESPPPPVHRAA